MTQEEAKKIKKVVVIDSQWHKVHAILSHPNLNGMKCVKITEQKTTFWRYQKNGDAYLATIEAIYYFYREFFSALNGPSVQYQGEYDNLLYLYVFLYDIIQKYYKERPGAIFRHKEGYIQYNDEEARQHVALKQKTLEQAAKKKQQRQENKRKQ